MEKSVELKLDRPFVNNKVRQDIPIVNDKQYHVVIILHVFEIQFEMYNQSNDGCLPCRACLKSIFMNMTLQMFCCVQTVNVSIVIVHLNAEIKTSL